MPKKQRKRVYVIRGEYVCLKMCMMMQRFVCVAFYYGFRPSSSMLTVQFSSVESSDKKIVTRNTQIYAVYVHFRQKLQK